MSARDDLIRRLNDPATYHQLVEDLAILKRAARRLRNIGWFLFGLVSAVMLAALALGGLLGAFFLIVVCALVYVWVFLFFLLGQHVQFGRRWAIGVSLALALVAAVISALCAFKNWDNVTVAVVSTVTLLGQLSWIRLLLQCWTVSRRIDALGERAVGPTPRQEGLLEID